MSRDPLGNVPIFAALEVWGDLCDAEHGCHGYGGNVAEIYSYRLSPWNPSATGLPADTTLGKQARAEVEEIARLALAALCKRFGTTRHVRVRIDGMPVAKWARVARFDHRAHVEVTGGRRRP